MSARRRIAADMAEAATAWLDSLDATQAATARGATPVDHHGEDDDPGAQDAERRRWFYTPTDHGGLTLHEQRPAQQRAAVRLLATGLSEAGFTSVAAVMGLENVLDRLEGFTVSFGRERGRDPGLYYLRVFGEPGPVGAWGWRFGGHHVSVNNLVVDGEVVATTPCFLGADPASAPLLGGLQHRPLAAVEDLARELVRSLPAALRERAVLLDRPPPDLVTANRTVPRPGDRALPLTRVWRDERFRDDGEQSKLQLLSDTIDRTAGLGERDHARLELTEQPRGIAGAELDPARRELLRAVLDTYTGRVPDGLAPTYDDEALDAVHLAWAGSTEPGAPHYYRLQGPRLLVEWDNTQRGANHAHSVWRDPEADFGLDVLRRHRAAHH